MWDLIFWTTALEIVVIKWILIGKVKSGLYKIFSVFYLRKWFVDQLMRLSLDLLAPLYSTLYLAPWYRLLGSKIGKNAEISTASHVSADLLTLKDGSFIADVACLGAPIINNGLMSLKNVTIGKRSFIGNSAVVPLGATIPDDSLVGCLSTIPESQIEMYAKNISWLGSPGKILPNRQESTSFSEEQTFKPTKKLYCIRAIIEYFRITLPATFSIFLICLLFESITELISAISFFEMLLILPLLFLALGVCAALMHIVIKWALIGKYTPQEKPLWSPFVWKTELLLVIYENFSRIYFFWALVGTPFINWFFQLLGARISPSAYMETSEITEFDLVRIEDNVILNRDCVLQTHLFEDRVMKMSHIHIRSKCCVGAESLILYDTVMEEGATLNDLSLLMKGEVLPPWTIWEGSPCKPIQKQNIRAP